jgi:putative hydrolase of the HAD superfamily
MDKIKIRALILDYGGVVSLPQNPENVNNLLRILGLEYNDFRPVYYDRRGQYDSGHVTGEQYWISILQHYGLNPRDFDISRLVQEDVLSWININEAMIRFITDNKSRFHKLAMISNMASDTLVYLRNHCAWLELFDGLCFSCEVGVNKPDREIYAACLRKLDLPPGECLFVDDSPKNVQGAFASGLHAIQFRTFPEFVQELDDKFVATRD